MEAQILNQINASWKPNELFLTMCKIRVGSVIEYNNSRYEVIDIPVMVEGNPVCILDAPIINPVRGDKIKIIKT